MTLSIASLLVPMLLVSLPTALCSEALATNLQRQICVWVPGDPVPRELLEFRQADFGVALPLDTGSLVAGIGSPRLLVAVLTAAEADERVVALAWERLILLAGPSWAFRELGALLRDHPTLSRRPTFQVAAKRTKYPHAWVEGVFVDEEAMTAAQGAVLLARVQAELRRGRPMQWVYSLYSAEEAYRPASGPHKDTWRTRLGNYGDFVVSPPEAGPPIARADMLEADHVARLLASTAGDVVVLKCSQAPDNRHVLYQVHEVYRPD